MAAVLSLVMLTGCSSKKNESVKNTAGMTNAEVSEKNQTKKREEVKMSAEALEALKGKEGVFAVLTTEKGQVVLNLFYKETPMTVANFVGLAEGTLDVTKGEPFYDGLLFHRVIADFMIQGGDPQGNGTGGPGYSFPDEFVDGYIFDKPGKLAMANSGPNSNGSQFFITHVPTDWLNYKHTIFGEVVTGQDVVDSVAQGDHIILCRLYVRVRMPKNLMLLRKSLTSLLLTASSMHRTLKKNRLNAKKRELEKDLMNLSKAAKNQRKEFTIKQQNQVTATKLEKVKT